MNMEGCGLVPAAGGKGYMLLSEAVRNKLQLERKWLDNALTMYNGCSPNQGA